MELSRAQRCTPTVNCHPANEVCENAFPVSASTTHADNTGANTSAIASSCAPSGRDVWYSYTTRCDGELWVDTCQQDEGSMVNSVLSIYDDCNGRELACNNNYSDPTVDCGLRSAAIAEVTQNQDVRIRVAGYGTPGYEGSFPLRVSEVPAPLVMASGPLPDAFTNDPYQVQLEYHGSCGPRRLAAAGLPPGLSIDSSTGVLSGIPLAAGHYVIRVDVCDNILPPDGQCAFGEVVLRVWPSNDDCAEAMPVAEGLYNFSNIGATTDGPDEPSACDFSGYTHIESDIWYRYTSSCNGLAIVDVCESYYDSKLAVYPGGECPMESAAWICDDDSCPELGPWVAFPVVEAREYVLRVGGYQGLQGRGYILVTCFNDCNMNEQSDAEEVFAGAPDCNGNARPDECDRRGDADANGVLDVGDWPMMRSCLTAPCGTPPCNPQLYSEPCCSWFDVDEDGDVDLMEVARLQLFIGS